MYLQPEVSHFRRCSSADLLFLFIEPSVDIIVSDVNPDMLEVGKKRAVEQGIFQDL